MWTKHVLRNLKKNSSSRVSEPLEVALCPTAVRTLSRKHIYQFVFVFLCSSQHTNSPALTEMSGVVIKIINRKSYGEKNALCVLSQSCLHLLRDGRRGMLLAFCGLFKWYSKKG